MDEKNAELLRSRSRAAFDAQAPTYDTGTGGEHARRLYPHVLAELVLGEIPRARLSCVDLSPRMAEAARERLVSANLKLTTFANASRRMR